MVAEGGGTTGKEADRRGYRPFGPPPTTRAAPSLSGISSSFKSKLPLPLEASETGLFRLSLTKPPTWHIAMPSGGGVHSINTIPAGPPAPHPLRAFRARLDRRRHALSHGARLVTAAGIAQADIAAPAIGIDDGAGLDPAADDALVPPTAPPGTWSALAYAFPCFPLDSRMTASPSACGTDARQALEIRALSWSIGEASGLQASTVPPAGSAYASDAYRLPVLTIAAPPPASARTRA